ncbi:MAG: hypothetical protein Q8P68_02630, partial [Candidatus Peregrinibacteria bacterium]|nr:hypothetical protein [Candidatus Peregrinibacteria bacterium]MDZ4245472.1 hypothetical protein [Candidatus Gracilibacteria bacterium]
MQEQIQNYIQVVVTEMKSQRAVSMVIALALLSVITIISLTSTYVLTNAIRGNTEFGSSIRAEAAADSGIELGLGAIRGKNPGWELGSADDPITMCFTPSGLTSSSLEQQAANYPCPSVAQQKVQYWITSSAKEIAPNTYIIPPPGEGNAGENCERAGNFDEILEPCNWNKLYFGETVSIPLYTTINGQTINPPDLPDGSGPGLGAFTLKVRTPCVDNPYNSTGNLKGANESDWCTNGSVGGPSARPDLFDATQSNIADNIIVN